MSISFSFGLPCFAAVLRYHGNMQQRQCEWRTKEWEREREKKHSRLLVLSLACELSTAPLAFGKLKHISSATKKIYNEPLKLRTPSLSLALPTSNHWTIPPWPVWRVKNTIDIKELFALTFRTSHSVFFLLFFAGNFCNWLHKLAFSKVCGGERVSVALSYRGFLAHWF